jgi:hypothetical protein
VLTFLFFHDIIDTDKFIFSKWRKMYMKAKGFRVFAVLFILLGLIVGGVAFLLINEMPAKVITAVLCAAIGIVLAVIFFTVANNKEKREKIRAAMEAAEEAVEDASILDAVEEEPVAEITLDEVASDLDELVEEIEEEAAAEEARNYHPAYKYVRDKIIEKTPVTEEQMDKAEKIGKVALPVAAAATVVLMAAKLVQYRKQEIRRRTFFDWLG